MEEALLVVAMELLTGGQYPNSGWHPEPQYSIPSPLYLCQTHTLFQVVHLNFGVVLTSSQIENSIVRSWQQCSDNLPHLSHTHLEDRWARL